MNIDFTKEEALVLLAVIGNIASTHDEAYKALLKLEQAIVDKFGDDMLGKIQQVENVMFDVPEYPFYRVEDKIIEVIK